MGLTVEQQVSKYLLDANRPFNTQLLVDNLQKFGIKKSQAQKALDTLVEKEKITCKEFGKTKLYVVRQDASQVMPKEELEAEREKLKRLQADAAAAEREVTTLRAEHSTLASEMTMEQAVSKIASVSSEIQELQVAVAGLEGTEASALSPEDQKLYTKAFADYMAAWRKRRGIFRTVWESISENLEQKTSELYEEIGIETDEAAECDFKACDALLSTCKRRRI